jgi:hypothetical protein
MLPCVQKLFFLREVLHFCIQSPHIIFQAFNFGLFMCE